MVLVEPEILGEVSPQSRCSDLQGVTAHLVLGPLRGHNMVATWTLIDISKRKCGTVATGTSAGATGELVLDMLK